ncbi:hypothetical protein L5515_015183 [Caenorhabditis briggsae]|uniref:Serpentine receptor class gamma n=1 Tax=Caenorhabditis briggsae TaxID=6238 RepID=A0AAE9EFA1_CAEBR|nr:hypothetical protein L5515_015183 [Caenorhabditis briggsae]
MIFPAWLPSLWPFKTLISLLFAFCSSCDHDILYLFQSWAFDIFTIGPAVIVVLTSKQIRESLFCSKASRKKVSVISVSGRYIAL